MRGISAQGPKKSGNGKVQTNIRMSNSEQLEGTSHAKCGVSMLLAPPISDTRATPHENKRKLV